ncbi:MAG TPA: hypothetical protein PK129_03955 [Cellvibrionaceae bacterium]|nr:hypothetical protein [Cellvibrionaceae bacterium]
MPLPPRLFSLLQHSSCHVPLLLPIRMGKDLAVDRLAVNKEYPVPSLFQISKSLE